MEYLSHKVIEAESYPGVRLTIRKVSFGRRIELLQRVQELAARIECLEAGEDPRDKLQASLLACQLDRIYILWGLERVEGLLIDGEAATPERLVEAGPEELCREALRAIKAEFGLSAEEEKN